jgi:hypothetical protein
VNRALTVLPNGDVIDAAVGYRAWIVTAEAGEARLKSLFGSTEWPAGGAATASCRCAGGHTCGIYAWLRPERVSPAPADVFGSRHRTGLVVGEVRLWGTVRIHTEGLRGWWAMPASLLLPRGAPPAGRLLVELAASQYGVPLVYNL